ncbi:hypothetical protein GCM10009117_19170 [Gangjinia marincola]|uniref:O-antigen ligase-related domain-containing protein n=1 Tax=Gangjinia marincola TaxID=578463 RepID=A0ABN1MIJ8_9FLAO
MQQLLQKLYVLLFYGICFLLPLERYVRIGPNILLFSLILLFPFVIRKEDTKKVILPPIVLLIVFSAYTFLNQLIFHPEQPLDVPGRIILSLLFIGLILPINNLRYVKQIFIGSVFLCVLISVGNMLSYYLGSVETYQFVKGDHIANALPIERLYLGFLCVISIILSVDLIGSKFKPLNRYYAINIVIVTAFVLLISSRLGIVLISILVLLSLFYKTKKVDRLISVLGLVLVLSIAFVSSPELRNRFNRSVEKERIVDYIFQDDIRSDAWNESFHMLKHYDYILKGIGFQGTKENVTKRINHQTNKNVINSHNQFVDFMLSAGIPAFLLFIAIFIGTFVARKKDYVKIALLLSIVFFLLIENLYHRQIGAYYVGLVMIFLVYEPLKTKKHQLDVV